MEPKIVPYPALRLVGLQIRTKAMSPEIPALWPRFVARIAEIAPVLESRVTYGAMQAPPDAPDALLYLASAPVGPATPAPAGMIALDIPAGDHAVFEFAFKDIGSVYPFIFQTWLPASGVVQATAPLLERYGADFNPANPMSPMQVRVPVRPRDA
jgi:AraC family transcriptional regulator